LRTKPVLVLVIAVAIFLAYSGITSPTGNVAGRAVELMGDSLRFLNEVVFGSEINGPDRETIRIASWNVENWGKAKSSDPERMKVIAETLSKYDIIAVQEISNIREQSDPGCPRNEQDCPGNPACGLIRSALEEYLNQGLGMNYSFMFSPQVKDERYLFVYDPGKAELLEARLISDPGDSEPICSSSPDNTGLMVRQPFMARFKSGDFDFVLLTAHTSPGINTQELEGLEHFYRLVEEEGEPDVILLGDLNADCSYLNPEDDIMLRNPSYIWVVDDSSDTTVSSTDCAYDRFIFGEATRADYTGSWGIDLNVPKEVSDHYPVWAEFYVEGNVRD
jgi:deoxyribonuclease-1-like protein